MGKIKLLLILAVLCILSLTYLGEGIAGTLRDVKARGRLIAGVRTDLPPFGFVDNKDVNKGFDIDIIQALAKELFGKGDAVEFIPITLTNGIGFLNAKKIDVLLGGEVITKLHKEVIDYSIPYFISGYLILAQDDSTITKYQDLRGKNVATIQEGTADSVIEELVPQANRVIFKGYSEAMRALKERRVDAFVDTARTVIHFQRRNVGLKIAGFQPFGSVSYGIGIRKGDEEWLGFVNATLTKMKETGQYQKLSEKWFAEAMALLLGIEKPAVINKVNKEKGR